MTTFGERLRTMRREAGMTQAALAESVGITNTYVSALESGRKTPPPRRLVEQLARALEADLDVLWASARHEREVHLQPRIEGDATSSRKLTKGRDLEAMCIENALIPAQDRLRELAMADPDLKETLSKLTRVLQDETLRASLLESLNGILAECEDR